MSMTSSSTSAGRAGRIDAASDRRIAIFSTLPIEAIFAAGLRPVDVNNLFVTHKDPLSLVRIADGLGVPRSVCAWTRGLLGAVVEQRLQDVVAVVQGDCSNNTGLARILAALGHRVIPFRFPLMSQDRRAILTREIGGFAEQLGSSLDAANEQFSLLKPIRKKLAEVDRLMAAGLVDSAEARLLLLSSTDMLGDPVQFEMRLDAFLAQPVHLPRRDLPRIAVSGVPTAFTNLFELLAPVSNIVLCETERDFAMVPPGEDLVDQYLRYSYAYGASKRIPAFMKQAGHRGVDGVIRYSQSFCHHNMEKSAWDRALGTLPSLEIEGDLPGEVAPRDRLRIDAFIRELSVARLAVPQAPATNEACSVQTPEQFRPCQLSRPVAAQPTVAQPAALGAAPPSLTYTIPGRTLGLDLGSRYAKVHLQDNGTFRMANVGTLEFFRRFTTSSKHGPQLKVKQLFEFLGCYESNDHDIVVTGYGRNRIAGEGVTVVPEIQAHAAGALGRVQTPEFLLIDLGGQDSKVMLISGGELKSFVMNDKCAAGSGRYVENMATLLEVTLDEIQAQWRNPVEITSTCATFGESEVVGLVSQGVPIKRICAGIMQSVASRTYQLASRLGAPAGTPLYIAGGLADSVALTKILGRLFDAPVQALPQARWNGAYGCSLLGGLLLPK